MQRATQTRTYLDAQHFPGGVNSYLEPQLLSSTMVRWAVNAVCRGGVWQTRPGFKTAITVDVSEGGNFHDWWVSAGQPVLHPQFCTIFKPTDDVPYLVFGISGSVFAARSLGNGQWDTPAQILGIQFDPAADQIIWCAAVRSSAPVGTGGKTAITPRRFLMLQDGIGRAAAWDGLTGRHLNPEKGYTVTGDGDTIYSLNANQTRIGKFMAWSGNRLWVSNGSQVFASDLNDPLYFTEETVLTSIPVFNFEDEVTAIADRGTSGVQQSAVFVWTKQSTYVLHSGVQNRIPIIGFDGTKQTSGWIDVEDFQKKIFSDVGCVSHKSVINHKGILYWYSNVGVVRFDSIGTVYSTQSLPPMDTEMVLSKQRMSPLRTGICAFSREQYAGWSVPVAPVASNGRVYNGHTQVYDTNVVPSGTSGLAAWQGIWTGINPVEWATGGFDGYDMAIALSMDNDGVIRLWEAFQGNRADNGHPIPWSIETRTHPVTEGPFSRSVFRHLACKLIGIRGNVTVKGYWRATRGPFHQLLDNVITAAPGPLFLQGGGFSTYNGDTSLVETWKRQTRLLVSEDSRGPEDGCTSMGVESDNTDQIDSAFSLLFKFTGTAALLAYRLAVDAQADNTEGKVMEDETGIRIVPQVGCPRTLDGDPTYTLPDASPEEAFAPIDQSPTEDLYSAPVI